MALPLWLTDDLSNENSDCWRPLAVLIDGSLNSFNPEYTIHVPAHLLCTSEKKKESHYFPFQLVGLKLWRVNDLKWVLNTKMHFSPWVCVRLGGWTELGIVEGKSCECSAGIPLDSFGA